MTQTIQNNNNMDNYDNQIHTLGRISSIIAAAAMVAVPLVATIVLDITLDIPATIQSYLGIGVLFAILVVVEFASYAPILGSGATYLCFITGNTLNMKLPAAISSVTLAGVEPNSKEADVISTLAVAVSSLVTIAVVAIGMFGLSFIMPILQSPVLKPGFDNLMPALMGALATPYFIKDFRTISVPAIIAAIGTIVLGYALFSQMQALSIPVFIIITVVWRYVLYRYDEKKKGQEEVAVEATV